MAAMKKGTKLKEVTKDFMLRVRMDDETLNKLDVIALTLGISRSEVVRRAIEAEYEKTQK